jgi:DNA-binding NtrC family response regulator
MRADVGHRRCIASIDRRNLTAHSVGSMNALLRNSALRTRSIDVLIVDEDTEASAKLQAVLEDNGCIARTIDSEDGAIAEVRRRRPEVVVFARTIMSALLAETIGDESPELGAIGFLAIVGEGAPSPGRAFDAYLREPTRLEEITDLVRRLGSEMRAARATAREAAL